MKVLIASDIHGSATHARTLLARIDEERPCRIALLGDILYHGPRNPLPDGYDPQAVVALLEPYAPFIVAVRGNCDSEVDQMVLPFRCLDTSAQIIDGAAEATLLLTHGHVLTPDSPGPLPPRTAFCSGHTHVKSLEARDGALLCNPGSVSLPKDGSRSYAVYENGVVALKRLDDGVTVAALELPAAAR